MVKGCRDGRWRDGWLKASTPSSSYILHHPPFPLASDAGQGPIYTRAVYEQGAGAAGLEVLAHEGGRADAALLMYGKSRRGASINMPARDNAAVLRQYLSLRGAA